MNKINESDFLKFDYKSIKNVEVKPIQLSAQILMIHEIWKTLDEMMDESPKNIITAKYLYYSVCEYIQELLKEYFDINPYILDNNPNLLSECYEDLKELAIKAEENGENFLDMLNLKDSEKQADIDLKKFIYIRDLYVMGNLLKLIIE